MSGFKVVPNENGPNDVSNQKSTAAKESTIQNIVQQPVLHQRAPLVPINRAQQQRQMHQAMEFLNPDFQAAGFAGFLPSCPSQFQYRMAPLTCAGNPAASSQNYTGCTFNFFCQENRCLSHNRRRSEGLTLLSQTTRIKLWRRLFLQWQDFRTAWTFARMKFLRSNGFFVKWHLSFCFVDMHVHVKVFPVPLFTNQHFGPINTD